MWLLGIMPGMARLIEASILANAIALRVRWRPVSKQILPCRTQRSMAEIGRVEMWRGGCRSDISVAASFVWRCLSGPTVTPFPHPAHPTGRADFRHPACMGLSLSREHHAILFVLCHFILLFDPRREHSSVPTAYFHRRRAQRRSRTALLQRRRRLVLDGREHDGRLPAIGWFAAR